MSRDLSDLLTAEEGAALRAMVRSLRAACAPAEVEIRLYGRRLHGSSRAIDLFLIVDGEEDAGLRRRVMRAAAESIEESDVVFTPVVCGRSRYVEMLARGVAAAVEVAESGIPVG